MKMAIIIYNEAVDEEVMQSLKASAIESFTKWRKVLGKGKISDPHLDSNVWPGANNVCMVVAEDAQVNSLLTQVKNLRQTQGKEGIKAFVLAVAEVV